MNLASLVNLAFGIGGKLLHDSPLVLTDKAGAPAATLQPGTFMGRYKLSLEMGLTYLEVEIAESAGVSQSVIRKVVGATWAGAKYSVARDEDSVTTERIQKLRLTPAERKQ